MSKDFIDSSGFRANVGIILCNTKGKLLLAGRVGSKGWQFPQGGMLETETALEAMYRELREEVGLEPDDVDVIAETNDWLRYRLPKKYLRHGSKPLCIGQKQRWFLLRLKSGEERLRFDCCDTPEFDRWRWVDYWKPVTEVIYFKRRVYVQALTELGPKLFAEEVPAWPRWWPKRWRAAFDKDQARKQSSGTD